MKNEVIIIKDPLYKQILVSSRHKKLLESKEFQRLRHIKQTSFVDLVYPSANHTRFSHSLGTYHLMRKVINNKLMLIPKDVRENLVLSALLHDIGHGPFSHVWERVFPHFDHEKATKEILKRNGLHDVAKIIDKKSNFSELISSTIDMDKLDYMARDSYFAGVSYGVAEVDFIIQHIYIKDKKMVIKPSALSSIEDLITQRVNLFKTVYFHKLALEFDFLFVKIFQRVSEIINEDDSVSINPNLRKFFEKKDTVDDLLALNDIVIMGEIFNWAKSQDAILRNLCESFLYRKKMRVINLAHKKIDVRKLKDKVAKEHNPRYFFGHIKMPIRILQSNIYVEIDSELKPIEEVSELIKFYRKQNWSVEVVVLPRDIKI